MRSKLWLILGIALAAIGALAAATQPWVVVHLAEGAAVVSRLEVTGQQLNASLSSIAIAALAAALVLSIAGTIFRRVLAVLVVLFGAGIVAISIAVVNDPLASAGGRIAEATGLAGSAQISVVASSETSVFIVVTIVCAAALMLFGVLVLVLGGRWKAAGRKYSARTEGTRSSGEGDGADPDRFSDWDAQNEGRDPSE